jgi:hypothetical protein
MIQEIDDKTSNITGKLTVQTKQKFPIMATELIGG